jgi:LmbE family N-acetylglucosaminyl deacetylase
MDDLGACPWLSGGRAIADMLELQLPRSDSRRPLRILCLGAHCDDIDIGCGGTLLKLLAQERRAEVMWVAFSASPTRAKELKASARRFMRRAARAEVVTHSFRDSYFPGQYAAIKDAFEPLKRLPSPDLIFTHHRVDRHQDHRIVSELTWNAFRNHLIFEYEIPKYDGGLTPPNAYVRLERAQVEAKVKTLLACYASQSSKKWFTAETFRGLMRLRGIEAAAESGWAEGFHVDKLCAF